jgi:sigma-B regulation protein RsbU (phosphoserine phosphatase)
MLSPIDRENEKLMMAVVRDVTEQKKIEKERAEFTEQLELQVKERTLELEQSHKLLETYLKDIKDSINYALLLQQAVLSERKVLNQLVEDSVIYYRPKDVVSGDFYWFNELDNGNGVVIIAADCTGHGVPGAFLSMLGINLLNNIVTENGIKYPSFILEELDVRLQKTLGKSANEQVLDGMDLSVISVDKRKKRLMFAGGGRPLIHISDNELHYIKGSRFGVGAGWSDEKRDYQTVIIDYKQGDIVYLFSDGYADQFGGERGRKMMIGKLKALLMNIHHLSGKEQEKAIEKHFTDWMGKNEQVDDILLMGVRL